MKHYIFGKLTEKSEPLDRSDLAKLLLEAQKVLGRLQGYPVSRIVQVLSYAGRLWRDPDYEGRKKCLEIMPDLTGFHPLMVGRALDALCDLLDKDSLERKISAAFGSREYLDRWVFKHESGGYLRASPLGIVLHVSAGNVFVGGIDSLVHGIISKNVNILKLSSQDPVFPMLFAESLRQADPDGLISNSFALLTFRGGDDGIERELKKLCDAIVVWGGEDAVNAYRKDLPLSCRLVEYGPKFSFAVITASGLSVCGTDEAAKRLASDVIMWEQRACNSPQVVYIEEKDPGDSVSFARKLAETLAGKALDLPPGELTADEQVEITRARKEAEIEEVLWKAVLIAPSGNTDWTVIFEKDTGFHISPLNRTIYIKPFRSWADILAGVVEMGSYIQTVGLMATPAEWRTLSGAIVRCGATRITELGKMSEGKPESPHDGSFQLEQLVRWANIESVPERFDLGEKFALDHVTVSHETRFMELVSFSRLNCSYYNRLYSGIDVRNMSDITRLPTLTGEAVFENTPPRGEGLISGPVMRAYVFASGGSTGDPKFCFYSDSEWEEVIDILSEVYQVAGITAADRVANLFMAGNLWTSFLVANQALSKVGCTVLPLAGNAEIKFLVKHMEILKPTALIGLPSVMAGIALELEKSGTARLPVRTILYGGEHVSPSAANLFEKVFDSPMIISAGYASVDAGPIGYQCPRSPGRIHHLIKDYIHLEILDTESDEAAPSGEPGEITVTNLDRRLMPMIRYRTGDIGRIITGECECGRHTPRFELMDRCTDVLRIGTADFYPDDLEKIVSMFPGVLPALQVVAERSEGMDRARILIEVDGACAGPEEIRRKILESNRELAEALNMGWLSDIVVETGPAGFITRNPRTGKIKRSIDKREII
ncbi:MAG: AMP-binding protein [Chloroflexi bacterium]|nr:AMP-binding protein [Chloroflexota bacterium]